MKPRKGAAVDPVGSFEEQVMLAVLRTGADAYAVNVRRELELVTQRSVTIGSVYITLDRLEAKELVASIRTTARDNAMSRRVFSVTPIGGSALAETKRLRERLWQGVNVRALRRKV